MRTLVNPLLLMLWAGSASGGQPVALRAEHFLVPPSGGPVTHVLVRNLRGEPYQGTVGLRLPQGWRASPAERPVALKPRATARLAFTIGGATNLAANAYPVEVAAKGAGSTVVRKQTVVCASAPYFKLRIDGRLGDWADAIPVTFATGGKSTVVRTFWNPRQFCLAVEVAEDKLIGYRAKPPQGGFDAVQFALAPATATTGTRAFQKSTRYEFLLAGSSGLWARDRCFALLTPGDGLAVARERRALEPLALKDARVSVKRRRGITRYECAIPAAAIPGIRLTVGREIRFSLLVHDPDGTGRRDLGERLGLWPSQRNLFAWCTWPGVQWGAEAPFDSKIEWGLCSSKH